MKNFTKLVLSGIVIASMTSPLKSQDVGIVVVAVPAPSSTIYPNLQQQLSFTLQNYGSSTLTNAQADSIVIELFVAGVRVQTSFTTPGDINLGGGLTTNLTNNQPTDWSTLGLGNSSQTVSICVKSRLKKNNVDVDVNPSNDELCFTVTYTGDNNPFEYDLSPTNLLITTPNYPSGSHVPLGGSISNLSYDLKNEGSADVIAEWPYEYSITVGGVPGATIAAATFNVIPPGFTETHFVTANLTLPLTKGPFDICLKLTPNSADLDNSNDETCISFIAGNPASVEDVEAPVYGNIFYNSRTLNMNFNELAKGQVSVSIFEITGRNAAEYTLDVDTKKEYALDLGKLSSGMYIANVLVNGQLMSYQFRAE